MGVGWERLRMGLPVWEYLIYSKNLARMWKGQIFKQEKKPSETSTIYPLLLVLVVCVAPTDDKMSFPPSKQTVFTLRKEPALFRS